MSKQNDSANVSSSVKTSRRYWRRTATPKPLWPWGIAPLAGLGILFLVGALFMAPRIEADVRGQVAEHMDRAGVPGTGVASNGQGVTIEAAVPREERIFVEALAKSTQCDTWAGPLTCPTSVTVDIAEPQAAPAVLDERPHRFTVEKTDNAVLLTGEVPNLEEHDRIVQAAGEHFDVIENELSISNAAAGPNYGRAVNQAISAASHLSSGTASWSGETLSVQGVAMPSAVASAREQFGAIGDASLQGDFDVQSLRESSSCNSEFNELLTNASIRFRTGSAEIDTGNEDLLARLAGLATSCPGSLTIAGHTDSQGDANMNESLSLARAAAVRDALATLGVDMNRMSAVGFGEAQPIAENSTREGRAKNRRIAIDVTN